MNTPHIPNFNTSNPNTPRVSSPNTSRPLFSHPSSHNENNLAWVSAPISLLYGTSITVTRSVLRGRYAGKDAGRNPNNVLQSRRITGTLLVNLPTSAVLTVDATTSTPLVKAIVDKNEAALYKEATRTEPRAIKPVTLLPSQTSVQKLTNVLSRTPLLSMESALTIAGGDTRAYLEGQGVKNWKQGDGTMGDGTPVTVFTATDNIDPNSKTKQPKRTYIFAFGKSDNILRRAYSETLQLDGSVVVRDEVHGNVDKNPKLGVGAFNVVRFAGAVERKPPPRPLVSSMAEDAPEVPKELLQHNVRYPNGIRFDPSRSLAGGGGGALPAGASNENATGGFALGAAPTFSNANATAGGNSPNRRAANAAPVEPIGKGSPLKVEAKEGIVALEASVGLFTFGTTHVLEKPVIEATFTLKNTGTKPLTIEKIAGSCECITAELVGKDKTLAPDATADVKVTLDTALAKPGVVQKTILVHTKENPDGASARLQIQGRLTPLVTFQPMQLSFGNLPAGEARKPQTVVATLAPELVKASKGGTLSAPPLLADDQNIRVRPALSQAGLKPDQIRYDVQVAPNTPNGSLLTTLSYGSPSSTRRVLFLAPSTNPADSPLTGFQSASAVVVSATIQGNIASEPALLAFGPVERKDAKSRTRTIVIAAPSNILKTIRFTCDNPKVTIKPLSPLALDAKTITLEVTLPANLPEGLLQAKLLAISTEKNAKTGGQETLAIPISAFFKKE
jgi:hypothetical protein